MIETITPRLTGITDLVQVIEKTNQFFLEKVQQQVNSSLTLRNWMIGHYIVEYEYKGTDRAEYGQKLCARIAENLKANNRQSLRKRHLYLCRNFYTYYPQIAQSLIAQSHLIGFQYPIILRTLSAQSSPSHNQPNSLDPNLLLERLSFSHFIELLNLENPLQRTFYELQTIKNN
jgi:hypothetical protein